MERRILALIGDFYHEQEFIRDGLNRALNETEGDVTYETQIKAVPWDNLRHFDLIVLAKSARINPEKSEEIWMNDEHQELLHDYVEGGGGYLVLHSGLAMYPTGGPYHKMVKGKFVEHPPEHPSVDFEVIDEGHPVTSDVDEFEIVDEQYFVEVDEEETNCILDGTSEEYGSSIAGWAHPYGRGRVCCLTPGHTMEVLNHPMMRKLIENSTRWLTERS